MGRDLGYKIWFLQQVGKGAIIAQQHTLVHRAQAQQSNFLTISAAQKEMLDTSIPRHCHSG